MSFENSAGLGNRNHYGPRVMSEAQKFGAEVSTSGKVKKLEWIFDFDDLPSPANLAMEGYIPDGAVILEASIQAIEGFVGGTSYDIGLQENDGTEIDNDGLWDALLVAEVSAIDEYSDANQHTGTNSGTLVAGGPIDAEAEASHTPIAEDGYLVVVATGTFTAGKARVLISYIDPSRDQTGNYTAGGVKGA